MKKKSGISLMVLAITIIVLAILVGMVVAGATIATQNAKMQTLANELIQIEDIIDTSVALQSPLPAKEGAPPMNADAVQLLIKEAYRPSLKAEMEKNKDTAAQFMVIDMKKLGAKNVTKGAAKASGSDIFVYASGTYNVYYVAGIHTGGESYYSITDSLTQLVKIEQPAGSTNKPDISVTVGEKLVITKDKTDPTNKLLLNIDAPKTPADKFFLVLGGNIELDITSKIVDKVYAFKVGPGITEANIELSNEIKIEKRTNNVKVAEAVVNISNMDVTPPVMPLASDTLNIKIADKGLNNIVTVSATDNKSGIAFVIYDYITKKDSSGKEVPVYATNAVEEKQIKQALLDKGSKTLDGIIKLPKYIKSIRILAVDKAGNASNYIEYTIPDDIIVNEL
ncbi:MAG: hypothetical protein RR489_00030 [Clostridia bacterium]